MTHFLGDLGRIFRGNSNRLRTAGCPLDRNERDTSVNCRLGSFAFRPTTASSAAVVGLKAKESSRRVSPPYLELYCGRGRLTSLVTARQPITVVSGDLHLLGRRPRSI